jgi:iron(III) transport system substrate-binding protein
MRTLTRRALLHLAALGAAASAAACVPGTAPAAPVAGVQVGQATRSAAPPVQDASWTTEWEDVVAAARREGRLSLITWGDRGYRAAIESFERAFPGITVDQLAESSASVWLGQVRQERRTGASSFDLAFVQPDAALTQGRPDGLWAPLRPLLFRPDVLDDAVWRGGLSGRFLDASGDLCFDWEYQVAHAYAINTDLVNEGQIRTVSDLLDPRWKGRILQFDPRVGFGLLAATSVAQSLGPEVLTQLLVDQQPSFSRGGPNAVAEALVHGRHPIAMGVRPKALNPLRDRGLGGNVRYLDLAEVDFVPSTAMLYFDRAPHPAAARLFANWILTAEGQTILTGGLTTNSARLDVQPFEPDGTGAADTRYYDPDREASFQQIAETRALVQQLRGAGA